MNRLGVWWGSILLLQTMVIILSNIWGQVKKRHNFRLVAATSYLQSKYTPIVIPTVDGGNPAPVDR